MKSMLLVLAVLFIATAVPATAEETETGPESLVVAAKAKELEEDHYLWAAEMVAARLKGNFKVLPGGLAAALRYSREQPAQVSGILEVMVDVYTAFEEVRITCYDPVGKERWKRKTELNTGGSEEKMARNMLDRVIRKIQKKKLTCQ